jgi:hypothetical protein
MARQNRRPKTLGWSACKLLACTERVQHHGMVWRGWGVGG